MKLYTVGYEGCAIEEFVQGLKKAKVNLIIDVRKNPVSRKKGFSKSRLAERLRQDHIGYQHLGGLGVPTAWRKKAKKKEITRLRMFRDYEKKILPKQLELLQQIQQLAKDHRTALLCYELDASDCHRRCISDYLVNASPAKKSKGKWQIIDLVVCQPKSGLSAGARLFK